MCFSCRQLGKITGLESRQLQLLQSQMLHQLMLVRSVLNSKGAVVGQKQHFHRLRLFLQYICYVLFKIKQITRFTEYLSSISGFYMSICANLFCAKHKIKWNSRLACGRTICLLVSFKILFCLDV